MDAADDGDARGGEEDNNRGTCVWKIEDRDRQGACIARGEGEDRQRRVTPWQNTGEGYCRYLLLAGNTDVLAETILPV